MTKKHFIKIAAILASAGDPKVSGSHARDTIALALADYFAQENLAFDTARFLRASAVGSGMGIGL